MATYKQRLTEDFGKDAGDVVGCALDRLGRQVSYTDVLAAVKYYEINKTEIDALCIGDRRKRIEAQFTRTT